MGIDPSNVAFAVARMCRRWRHSYYIVVNSLKYLRHCIFISLNDIFLKVYFNFIYTNFLNMSHIYISVVKTKTIDILGPYI